MSSFFILVNTRLSLCGIDLDEQLRRPNHSSLTEDYNIGLHLCVRPCASVSVCVCKLVGKRKNDERERKRDRVC